jgi:hypothetical protein
VYLLSRGLEFPANLDDAGPRNANEVANTLRPALGCVLTVTTAARSEPAPHLSE